MEVINTAFGPLQVDSEKVITFPTGLIGFPQFHRFVVVDRDGGRGVLKYLQCLDEPSLGFVTVDPRVVFADYAPEMPRQDLESIGISSLDEALLLCVVVVPPDIKKMTCNLRAPVVVNPETRMAKQIISISPEYETRYYVFPVLESLLQRTG
ncbi:MAG TPA: flagellar assembly protein FliW [Firmicutes bacterium]|nr:flagellar assembly protein FliW [Candidatus Fermentithermobacillaceae bacterium]